ncbi:MAG: class I adenylate-forming enzyme family protein [Bacillota bacterium]|nr:class I adenylate-forming enzyme family protein [Bacillota bacterium]
MYSSGLSPWKLFENSCVKYGGSYAVACKDIRITYLQMHRKIIDFAYTLEQTSFTMAGIYLPNCIEFITCLLALNKCEKITVPLSYQLKGESLYERINYSDIELLITDSKGYEEIYKIRDRIKIRYLIVLKSEDTFEIKELESDNKSFEGISRDTFGICFTGGSTSSPKGVVLSNSAVSGNAAAVAEFLDFSCSDKFLMARPFTQAGPIASDMLMCLSRGGEIIIMNDLYHPAVFLKAIEDYKATTTYLVRTMLAQILEYPKLSAYDLSSMKRIILGAMITPESIINSTHEKLPGIDLYNAYGLSEASVRVTFCGPDEMLRFPGSTGKPLNGCDVKVYLQNGEEAKAGEEGEIFVLSDYVMDGYYKRRQLTEETLTEKGLRTKDSGYINKEGYLYIVGRTDDLIIQGGNNVYPVEIEEVLLRNKEVYEAVVLGIPDEKLGQRIVAMVRASEKANSQGLYKWCRLNLEDRKIPREIHIIDSIPRNEMGKINKNQLRTLYESLAVNTSGENINYRG